VHPALQIIASQLHDDGDYVDDSDSAHGIQAKGTIEVPCMAVLIIAAQDWFPR
jgi:hypothetical protein